MIGGPQPLGTRAKVDGVLAELLPGYTAADDSFECPEFVLEIYIAHGDPVDYASFTPRGDRARAIVPVFAFAERFGAYVFSHSGCDLLTPETALAEWNTV